MTRKRWGYLLFFIVLFLTEAGIALFIHDRFVRPYVGDILIPILLCCFVRCIVPNKPRLLALYVFLFSASVELSQLLKLADQLGIQSRVLRIAMGSTFDWADIVCYFIGCVLFYVAEKWLTHRMTSPPA